LRIFVSENQMCSADTSALSPQAAVKGFSVTDGGITYTLKCELLPKTSADIVGTE